MKVLFVTHYSGFGGANQSLLHLARLLRDRHGVEPLILLPYKGTVEEEIKKHGIRYDIIRFASWRGPRTGLMRLIYGVGAIVLNAISAIRIAWRYRKEHIDVVHANSSLAFFGWCYGKLTSIPVVWHIREYGGQEDYCNLIFFYGERISGLVYGTASACVAISEAIKRRYSEFIRPCGNIHTIYNGIDVDYARTQMEADDTAINELRGFKLAFVGGINYTKNPFEIVRALSLIKTKGELRDIHLYLVGDGKKEDKARLASEIEEVGLDDRVHVLGFRENIWPLLSRMDVSIVPSVQEGFGRTAVEGMICALPVIATDTGGLPEVVLNGETGFIYKQGDVKALAEKILLLREDEVLRRRLGHAGHERAINLFGADSNADRVFDLYGKVMGKGK